MTGGSHPRAASTVFTLGAFGPRGGKDPCTPGQMRADSKVQSCKINVRVGVSLWKEATLPGIGSFGSQEPGTCVGLGGKPQHEVIGGFTENGGRRPARSAEWEGLRICATDTSGHLASLWFHFVLVLLAD